MIQRPMDLGTISAKLENGMYASRQGFVADVKLVIKNALSFNRPGEGMYNIAKAFERYWNGCECGGQQARGG
jgi:transcription initiation factor TFIID subunit 2